MTNAVSATVSMSDDRVGRRVLTVKLVTTLGLTLIAALHCSDEPTANQPRQLPPPPISIDIHEVITVSDAVSLLTHE